METLADLETRRERLLVEMRAIRSMKRATINEQFLKVPHKGKAEPVLRGPYYVMSWREKGKTVGRRLTSQTQLNQARKDIEAHKRFLGLCQEFVQVTERLGELERRKEDEGEQEKKRRRSRSSRIPR
jgi:hypothetical protein